MSKKEGKLVRDKIPAVIEADGLNPVTRVLSEKEYLKALLDKLVEEAEELRDDPGLAERADIAEVLVALDGVLGLSPEAIEAARLIKADSRGVFKERIFLEEVK